MGKYGKTITDAYQEVLEWTVTAHELQEKKKVTKREIKDLENDNEHGMVALKLAQSFGTPKEVKKIQDINKRHQRAGEIESKDQKERNAGSSIVVRDLSYSFSKTPMGLGDFFKEMRSTLHFEGELKESHLKFKVYRVKDDAGTLKTRQLLTASGFKEGKNIRSQAVVEAVWTRPTDNELPELLSFSMPSLIQSEFREKDAEGFEDIASIANSRFSLVLS